MASSQEFLSNELRNALQLRRSDRKKIKKTFKDDFMLPNPFKCKNKKQKIYTLPQNLDHQIKKIQYLTQRSLSMLNYGKHQFNESMLQEMKSAVFQQQNKLESLISIKLIAEINLFQYSKIQKILKNQNATPQKKSISRKSISVKEQQDQIDFQKEGMGIATAEQLQFNPQAEFYQISGHNEVPDEQSEYFIPQIPKFRKESSKLLSDNYQNNELLYTLDHIVPSWHAQFDQDSQNPQSMN